MQQRFRPAFLQEGETLADCLLEYRDRLFDPGKTLLLLLELGALALDNCCRCFGDEARVVQFFREGPSTFSFSLFKRAISFSLSTSSSIGMKMRAALVMT